MISASQAIEPVGENPQYTGGAIFFCILMVVALVIIGEFAFHDSNSLYNPYFSDCQSKTSASFLTGAKARIPANCSLEKYERTRLILHADIVAPVCVVVALMYLVIRKRVKSPELKLIFLSVYLFAGWILIRLISETEYYLLNHRAIIGHYVVLVTIVIILASLIFIVQERANRKVVS